MASSPGSSIWHNSPRFEMRGVFLVGFQKVSRDTMFSEPAFNVFNVLFNADPQKSLSAAYVLKAAAALEGIYSAFSVAANEIFYLIFGAITIGLKVNGFPIRLFGMDAGVTSLAWKKSFAREKGELLFGGVNNALNQLVPEGGGPFINKHGRGRVRM